MSNGRSGVFADNGGVALLSGGNDIRGHGSHGIGVNAAKLSVGNVLPSNSVTGNAGSGITAVAGSSLTIGNVSISGNAGDGVTVGHNSTLRVLGSSISGNTGNGIWAGGAAAVLFVTVPIFPGSPASPPSITGNLWGVFCADLESSLGGPTSGVTANKVGDVNCSGFWASPATNARPTRWETHVSS